MSLFDVIKYPISNPPTKDELEALPNDLYKIWLLSVGWAAYLSPIILAIYYFNHYSLPGGKDDLSLLRKMIKEYDNI